jgi:hypothetical protein
MLIKNSKCCKSNFCNACWRIFCARCSYARMSWWSRTAAYDVVHFIESNRFFPSGAVSSILLRKQQDLGAQISYKGMPLPSFYGESTMGSRDARKSFEKTHSLIESAYSVSIENITMASRFALINRATVLSPRFVSLKVHVMCFTFVRFEIVNWNSIFA